jgi:hypothetical protein
VEDAMNRKTGSAVQGSISDKQPRRAFVKTAAYLAPAILTLKAVPSFASSGSGTSSATEPDGRPNPSRGKGYGKGHAKGPKKEKNAKHPRK